MNEYTRTYHPYLNRDRLVHIVDNDLRTCEALSVLFRLEGYQTAFSESATSFFATLERRHPDAVIASLGLPGDGGTAILRHIKSMHTATPVFLMSDRPDVSLAVAAMK